MHKKWRDIPKHAVNEHGEADVERLVRVGLVHLGLWSRMGGSFKRKGDPRKVAITTLLKFRTSVGNERLAKRLEMGHTRTMICPITQRRKNTEIFSLRRKLEKI